jgi:hypothetical protein
MPKRQWHEKDPRFQTQANYLKLKMCPKVLRAIQQPLQYCDKSPTQEPEPYDHHRYDQCGKQTDRDFPAGLRRRQSGFGWRILQPYRSLEIKHFVVTDI